MNHVLEGGFLSAAVIQQRMAETKAQEQDNWQDSSTSQLPARFFWCFFFFDMAFSPKSYLINLAKWPKKNTPLVILLDHFTVFFSAEWVALQLPPPPPPPPHTPPVSSPWPPPPLQIQTVRCLARLFFKQIHLENAPTWRAIQKRFPTPSRPHIFISK